MGIHYILLHVSDLGSYVCFSSGSVAERSGLRRHLERLFKGRNDEKHQNRTEIKQVTENSAGIRT